MKTFSGKTADAGAPILSARVWKKGLRIEGVVIRSFLTANGECYEIQLQKPLELKDGSVLYPPAEGQQKLDKVSIGALKGFQMALAAAGLDKLEPRDRVTIECIGTSTSGKGNDRVDFIVGITRP